MDEFTYTGLGREGNRVELVKRIGADQFVEGLKRDDSSWVPLDPEAAIEVRPMSGDDAIGFARDVYRSYGYSYDNDWAYRPADIRARLEDGTLAAWVVVTPADGALIGHLALRRNSPWDRLGNVALAMIDPRARNRHLASQLGAALVTWAADQQLYGLWAEATTIHPFSQRATLAIGAHELALLLSYIPAEVSYASLDSHERRVAVMIMYARLSDNSPQPIYAPPGHAAMLRRIYEPSQLRGDFASVPDRFELPDVSSIKTTIRGDHNAAEIDVRAIGRDLGEQARVQLTRARRAHLAVAYLDLPLSQPGTPSACAALEELGFFFGGVLPVDDDLGFRLRMQYLIDPDVRRDDIVAVSDLGRELLDYVWVAYPDADQAERENDAR